MFKSIRDITVNRVDDIIVLIKNINVLRTKSGAPYQKILVRDMYGNESSFLQFDIMLTIKPPAIVRATVECAEYGASVAVKMRNCMVTDECSMDAFLPKSHTDPATAWKVIVKYVKTIRNSLSRIVCSIIADDKTKMMVLPLHPMGAFARQSGILEATSKLITLADTEATVQNLDRDLMIAGAILYFNGTVDTIDEGYNYTVSDLMYGPSIAGYSKIQAKSMELIAGSEDARNDISGEDVMMLCHILAVKSGAVKPVIPEAAALKNLGIMICQVDDMNETIAQADTAITIDDKNFSKRVYKRESLLASQD